jgi:hypothetical protein
MINTLRNFAPTHHVSGINLNFNIKPGIFFMFNLAFLTLVLITSDLTVFTGVTFALVIFTLIGFILVNSMLVASCSRIHTVAGSLKTVFFEGVL